MMNYESKALDIVRRIHEGYSEFMVIIRSYTQLPLYMRITEVTLNHYGITDFKSVYSRRTIESTGTPKFVIKFTHVDKFSEESWGWNPILIRPV